MSGDFVITGTRPPSATGMRPVTATSRDFGYYTKKLQSTVDETLFQSHHASSLNAPVDFPAPWEKSIKGPKDMKEKKKKKKPGPPLLWAPAPTESYFNSKNSNRSNNNSSRSKAYTDRENKDDEDCNSSVSFGTIQGIPLKHQYHRLKHTPTFVDETLFGDPLMEPSFKAPWEEKLKVKQSLGWYPDHNGDRRPHRRRRPATALGLRGQAVKASAVPVWKP